MKRAPTPKIRLRCCFRQRSAQSAVALTDRTGKESDDDGTSELLEANVGDLLAVRTTTESGEPTSASRVPRRSRIERYERELDAWFAELVAAQESDEG